MKRMKPDPNREDMGCACGDLWPPIHAKVYGPNPEDSRGKVSGPDFERLCYWHRACGLLQMEEGKCLQCPHVIVNGKRVNMVSARVKAAPSNRNVMKT